jgi:hypothetical protein
MHDFYIFEPMVKSQKNIKNNENLLQKLRKAKIFLIKPGGGGENCSELRIEPGGFHEPEEPVAMKMGVNHMA